MDADMLLQHRTVRILDAELNHSPLLPLETILAKYGIDVARPYSGCRFAGEGYHEYTQAVFVFPRGKSQLGMLHG